MKKPNETIEVFMSLIKWFFIVLLLNNAIWFGVVYSLVNDTTEETTLNQDGENNTQGINYGTIN